MPKDLKLTEDQLRVLQLIAKSERRTVEDMVRQIIDDFLATRRQDKQEALDAAFGIWGKGEDGLAYQERLRHEW